MLDKTSTRANYQITLPDPEVRTYETRKFYQRRPFYRLEKPTPEELSRQSARCLQSVDYRIPSNPRYFKFNHLQFHAGDLNQFERYGLYPLWVNPPTKADSTKTDSPTSSALKLSPLSSLYQPFGLPEIKNMYHYLSQKFKKGIFVSIQNQKLEIFLPFSLAQYRNDFFTHLAVDDSDRRNLQELERLLRKQEQLHQARRSLSYEETRRLKQLMGRANRQMIEYLKKIGYRGRILHDRTEWVANNCMFRNSYPTYEGDQNVNVVEVFLVELLKHRTIPDVCFFMNLRDHPLLNQDLTEPYDHLFGADQKMDDRWILPSYVPLFSFSPHEKSADLPMITPDDMIRINPDYLYPDKCQNFFQSQYDQALIDDSELAKSWLAKKAQVIFRGKGTGCGLTPETNVRLRVHQLGEEYPEDLDTGIVNLNSRLKKESDHPLSYLKKQGSLKLKSFMSMKEQLTYRYHLLLEGHSAGYRAGGLFGQPVLIFIAESRYQLWFSPHLQPMIHYIPVKADLSDLISQKKWCDAHPEECLKIIQQAQLFYQEHLTEEKIYDYTQQRLTQVAQLMKPASLFTQMPFPKNIQSLISTKPRILIGAPYRIGNQKQYLPHFKRFCSELPRILSPYREQAEIHLMVMEQSEHHRFNRGALANLMITEARKMGVWTNLFIFDIDNLLSTDGIPYLLQPIQGVRPLGLEGTRYTSTESKRMFFGAILGFGQLPTDFPYFPNQIYGWGIEDDLLINRVAQAQVPIEVPPTRVSILDFEDDYWQINDKLQAVEVTPQRVEKYLYYHQHRAEPVDTIRDLKYELLQRSTEIAHHLPIHHLVARLFPNPKIQQAQLQGHSSDYAILKKQYQQARRQVHQETQSLLRYLE